MGDNSVHSKPQPQCGLIPCVPLTQISISLFLFHWWQLCAPSHSVQWCTFPLPCPHAPPVTCHFRRGHPKTPVRPYHSFPSPSAMLRCLRWLPIASQLAFKPFTWNSRPSHRIAQTCLSVTLLSSSRLLNYFSHPPSLLKPSLPHAMLYHLLPRGFTVSQVSSSLTASEIPSLTLQAGRDFTFLRLSHFLHQDTFDKT